MQVAAAGTGVDVCDGSSNVLPVGRGSARRAAAARAAGRALAAPRLLPGLGPAPRATRHPLRRDVRVLRSAFPTAATGWPRTSRNAGGAVLDEPATAQGIAAVLVRGLNCGALDETEVVERAGVDRAALAKLFARRVG